MRLKIIFLILTGILCFPKAFADSPLTSTPFHEAYQEEKIVQLALNAAGVITPKLMKYLSHPRKPIAIKLANKAKSHSNSYAIHLVASLIEAQQKMESDWCGVFLASDQVRNNSELHLDFDPGASAIIYNYMDLYADNCPKN